MKKPVCTIVAGPNGAGKTTFALNWLPALGCQNFVNADLIAAGLSPLSPEREWIAASRLLLREIADYRRRREDFAFETTLAGKTYLRLIEQLRIEGWRIVLYYFWLPTVEMSIDRVAERVAHGGHDIPLDDITRRYPRSIRNLLDHYSPLCDTTFCLDGSDRESGMIFTQDQTGRIVKNKMLYDALLKGRDHD